MDPDPHLMDANSKHPYTQIWIQPLLNKFAFKKPSNKICSKRSGSTSVPDPKPIRPVTFGLSGSISIFWKTSGSFLFFLLLSKKFIVRSIPELCTFFFLPVVFTGLCENFVAVMRCLKTVLVNNHWKTGRIRTRIRILILKVRIGIKGSGS